VPTWPFWVLFLAVGVIGLLVVRRFDALDRRTR